MTARRDSTLLDLSLPTQEPSREVISVYVSLEHPLLRLKAALDWEAIESVMVKHWSESGKNLSGGRGLSFPVSLYVPLLVLMAVKGLNSRQAKEYLEENVVARKFVGLDKELESHVRDHSSIARVQQALGLEGYSEVNQLIVKPHGRVWICDSGGDVIGHNSTRAFNRLSFGSGDTADSGAEGRKSSKAR
jgi:hypothetical protein